ncbi:MAG TPA: hypothetical protein VK961_24920 [Chthoniobacter sp.]|nr:hypothetical protein [Chthoniobacter sp.]
MPPQDETVDNPLRPWRLAALLVLGIVIILLFASYSRARGQAERLLAQDKWHWERRSSRLHFLDATGWQIPFWEFTYESGDAFDAVINLRYTLTGTPIPPTLTQIPR